MLSVQFPTVRETLSKYMQPWEIDIQACFPLDHPLRMARDLSDVVTTRDVKYAKIVSGLIFVFNYTGTVLPLALLIANVHTLGLAFLCGAAALGLMHGIYQGLNHASTLTISESFYKLTDVLACQKRIVLLSEALFFGQMVPCAIYLQIRQAFWPSQPTLPFLAKGLHPDIYPTVARYATVVSFLLSAWSCYSFARDMSHWAVKSWKTQPSVVV